MMSAFTLFAQTDQLTGRWLLTKAEMNRGTRYPYQIFEFRNNGKLMAMGTEVGTWQYKKGEKSLILNSKLDKDFNGTGKIEILTDERLVMTNACAAR